MFRLFALVALLGACTPGEGERCNPLQFSNDCNSGFQCVYPTNCGVAYCCPTNGSSTNPNCQSCPGDGGTD